MSEVVSSARDALIQRAREVPDVGAYTFVDCGVDPAGYAETLTWSQVYGRARVVAEKVVSHGSPGDRVAIIAPQGLDYIIAFFGAMLAGRVAVPLPAPVPGRDDERVIPALRDGSPTVVLTTSAVVNGVVSCIGELPGIAPALIEVDALDLTAQAEFTGTPPADLALLQYASGSTRKPAGVMIADRTIAGNVYRVLADLFDETAMAGLDLGDVHTIISGGEQIHATTIKRFMDRFTRLNLPANAVAPSNGLAEAMYAGSAPRESRPTVARFDYAELADGYAKACRNEAGLDLVSIGAPRACTVRIVDPETHTENPDGKVGEIWLHGANVAGGYWRQPEQSERVFGGRIVDPTPGTPAMRWLRTGDLGVVTDGEFFMVGRIKDLLIGHGRNHYPDDIEATIQKLTGGRAVAISVLNRQSEQLVPIVELKNKGGSDQEILDGLQAVKQKVTSAISKVHGLRLADVVMVSPGTTVTTSSKARRSGCVERYRRDQFSRSDAVRTLDMAETFR